MFYYFGKLMYTNWRVLLLTVPLDVYTVFTFGRILKTGFLSSMENSLISYAYSRLYRQMTFELVECNKSGGKKSNQISHTLASFRQSHTLTTKWILHYSVRLVAPTFISFLSANVPFNAYALSLLFFLGGSQIDGNFRLFLYFYLLINSATPLTAALQFVYLNKQMLGSLTKLFLKVVQKMERVRLNVEFREKWKCMTYFECMHHKGAARKWTVSAGSVYGSFTRRSLFKVSKIDFNVYTFLRNFIFIMQFIFIYAAYIMFFSGKFIHNLPKNAKF